MKKRINFTKLIQIWGIIFLIGTGVSIIVIDIARSYRDFNFYADQMRADYTASQKQIIKNEVKRVVDRINYEKAQSKMITKSKIKSRTYEAYSTAQNIHQQNQGIESKAKIQQMIRDALRPVRFENGSSYYFAVSMDGIEQLYPVQPELEGKNLIGLQDSKGNFVIQDEINVIKKSGEGFVTDFWPKPGKDPAIAYEKISFVKYFKPLDWYFGTGLYVDDVENQIKADLLSTISRIRFGKEGYIFVNRLNGEALVSNGKLVSGEKKLWEVFDNNPEKTKKLFDMEYNAALKPEGDYIYYSLIKLSDPTKESPKASFVQGIPELQWLVGAGVYLDDVETDIARMQTELNNHTKMKMFYSALIVTGIFIFYLILFSRLSRRLATDFNIFISFFNRSVHSDETINRDKVHFIEFDLMAKNANQMLQDKVLAQQNLMAEKERLRQSEERFKTLSNLTFEGILIHNNGVVIDSNNAATKIIGYTRKELIGKNIIQLCIPPEYHAIVQENIVKNSPKPYELMAKRKDGTVFPVEIEARNIKEGNKIFRVTALRDITERRQAEDTLRENERYLGNIINAIADLIFVKNREHKWVLLNDAFCQFVGHNREELLGKSDYDVFPKDEADVFWKKDEVVFTSGKENINEENITDAKGKVHTIVTKKAIYTDDKNEQYIVGIVNDITDRVSLEEQLRQAAKMESIGTLTGGIAHDFNNLLYMIVGNTELALKDIPKWNPAYTNLEEIKSASLRAAGIVKQLLTFSRKTDQKRIPIDAVTVIKDSLNFLRSTIPATVEIHEHLPDDDIVILADSTQVNQIIMNLCINASQAMEETGGTLKINIEKTICEAEDVKEFSDLVPGNYLKITVNDTGPGISPEIISRIFDPYFTTKEMGKGSGMGLSIVHGAIKNHGGAIWVDSSLGKGSTFTLLFPMVDEKPVNKVETNDEYPTGTETILFVDDEQAITDMTQKILEKLGYRVEAILNPLDALDLFQSKPNAFDLVITDMTMPQMTGAKLAQKLKEIQPGIPIIICTGHSSLIDEEKAKRFGIDGYLMKPASMSTIAKAIRNVLDK